MDILRYAALVLCSIALVVSAMGATILLSGRVLLYPELYQQLFAVYSVYDLVKDQIPQQEGFTIPELEQEQLTGTINTMLGNLLAYVRGETADVDLRLSIDTSSLMTFFEQQAAAVPVCPPDMDPYVDGQPVCRPADMSASVFISSVLKQQGIAIPQSSSVNLADMIDSENNLARVQQMVRLLYNTFYGCVLAVIMLIAAIFLLSSRRTVSFFRWVGASLFLAGLLGIVSGYLAQHVALSFLPAAAAAYREYIDAVVRFFIQDLNVISALLLIVGVACILFGIIFRSRQEKKKIMAPASYKA